ncbi:guanylate kinase [Halonatronum saccharophilum]|uniref:guanylate kinase n=1 Tax=Halonatronum saccharophilum TaxID=150060 RepID=UPI0004837E66|nr:guanylate kinase [Halonatronum saccharophilum]
MLNSKNNKGNLIVLSGPSAVGKGTVLRSLLQDYNDISYSVSATTRKPREGEVDGIDYFFMSKDKFKNLVDDGEFIEWAKVHNNYYGTPKNYVKETLAKGKDVILEIDIQGAKQVRDNFSGGVFVFLAPPSLEDLKDRITKRGTESDSVIDLRMENATKELEEAKNYDYLIVNDEVDRAVDKLRSVIIAQRCMIK